MDKAKIYHWMITNLPTRLMYKSIRIDSQHQIHIPRWGWSKKQITDAEKRADELEKTLNWK